jgi:prepilin-type N-terminal cleavage/methylation domain-containing protein
MTDIYQGFRFKTQDDAFEAGFTLIELLIVIVVLGILAVVVVSSLVSVTGNSAVSACQADGGTVETAIAAYFANNDVYPTSTSQLTGVAAGGPYIQSWPVNSTHYTMALGSGGAFTVKGPETGATPVTWSGSTTCTNKGANATVG